MFSNLIAASGNGVILKFEENFEANKKVKQLYVGLKGAGNDH